jgi:hypothetical protein
MMRLTINANIICCVVRGWLCLGFSHADPSHLLMTNFKTQNMLIIIVVKTKFRYPLVAFYFKFWIDGITSFYPLIKLDRIP